MKDDATITSNIDNEKANFSVKFYELPNFDGEQDHWINFRESFESIL